MTPAQQALFDPALLPPLAPAALPAGRATVARQRWWRLQGEARHRGRKVEPVLVTPGLLARIDVPDCPVTRSPMDGRGVHVVALRADAAVAAGHLASLGARAAAAAEGVAAGGWQAAWATAARLAGEPGAARAQGLCAAEWHRLAVLCSFVHPLTPAQAGALPLHVLPPPRLRVLSPVQALQVALTLALGGAEPARPLNHLVSLGRGSDLKDALRVFVLTLLARRPVGLESLAVGARRRVLEDLWDDPLLGRRWQRLASRLDDAQAHRLLSGARSQNLLGGGWRLMDADAAVDGWDLPDQGPGRRVG
ncbi:MAG: hypothetical protein OEU93_09670 [Rubrivivax sp.]|nr:hypothetical protein [Rubrivivax sp.]MDH5338300.1 hypothetical protein [Rubrivivax sp.]